MEQKLRLSIGGMTCVNCQNKIEKGLRKTDGVLKASVSYKRGEADVTYDPERVSYEALTDVIRALDYEVLSPQGGACPV